MSAASWLALSATAIRISPGSAPGGGDEDWPAAPAGAERDDRGGAAIGRAEPVGELGDGPDVGAAEGVDRLVGIPDGDQLAPVTGQRAQQRFLSRVAVLVLVHQDDVVGLALTLAGRGPAQQGGRDADDLRVVVGGDRREVEARRVTVEEAPGGHPVLAPALAAEGGDAAAIHPAFGGPEQEVAQLLGEPPGGQGRAERLRPVRGPVGELAAQQPADLEQLLGPGQQAGRLLSQQRELPAHQGVSVAVEGERERLPDRAVQPSRDALAQLAGRLAAEGEHQHPGRVQVTVLDPVRHRLDDGGRLAGARAGQHEQRAAGMADHSLLRGVEAEPRGGRGRMADQPVGVPGVGGARRG
jgi:hypothetical protein